MEYLQTVFMITLTQLAIFVMPGLLLSIAMQLTVRGIEQRAYGLLGQRTYLLLFGWLGTSIHELGHALFCIIFRHDIVEMKLFSPDQENGTLGYVRHRFNPNSLYQRVGNFFIGIGPILLGSCVIFIASRLLIPTLNQVGTAHISDPQALLGNFSSIISSAVDSMVILFAGDRFSDWRFYAFLYISFSVGTSITLSVPDLKGAASGLTFLLLLIISLNALTTWAIEDWSTIYSYSNQFFYSFYFVMCFALILNLLFRLVLSFLGIFWGK